MAGQGIFNIYVDIFDRIRKNIPAGFHLGLGAA